MRPQQLLALCLLACVAGCALAYEKEYEKKEYYGGEKEYEEKNYYDKDYHGESKEYYEYEHDHKPDCGPYDFPELKGPTCIIPSSGQCVPYDEKTCKEDGKTNWCKKVNKKWACKYEYKYNGQICRAKKGSCDLDDKCSGDSPKCPNNFVEAGTVCKDWKEGPCVLASKCDGKKPYCPGKKYAPHGTPCADGELYEEAYDEHGKVYAMSEGTEAEALAKKHKWYKCSQRCYEGECGVFNKKWWKKDDTKEDKKHHKEHKDDYEKEDKTDYGEKEPEKKEKKEKEPEKDYYEVESNEYYETKYDYSDDSKHHENYYCKKKHSSY